MKPNLTRTIRAVRASGLSVTAVVVAPDGTVTINTAQPPTDLADELAEMRAVRAKRKAESDPRSVAQRYEAASAVALAAWDRSPRPKSEADPPRDRLLIGVAEAARMMGVSKTTVWRRIGLGEIATRKLGVRTLIHRDELSRFMGAL